MRIKETDIGCGLKQLEIVEEGEKKDEQRETSQHSDNREHVHSECSNDMGCNRRVLVVKRFGTSLSGIGTYRTV